MTQDVRGPAAPKDPIKKGAGFYVIRDKRITGSPDERGGGTQHLYEDMGRLINSAKIDGNITDEEILTLLETVEGFRKLVRQIGVSVESDDPGEIIHFVFQMYGKTDRYKTGSNIEMDIPANGVEQVIDLDTIDWSEDDDVPGQIRFEFAKAETFANASVKFYLNDGFKVPEPEEETDVDFDCREYGEMIKKSLLQLGNVNRLKRAIKKARRGEDTTVSYIGGSITQGAGAVPINMECYAYRSFLQFCKLCGRAPDDNVRFIKAGVGGTPSELGMIRYEMDLLRDGTVTPDVVVIEFAVNDEGDETKGVCYDSLVRKVYDGPGKPAVILLFSVFADDWNLEERLSPVGRAYNLPMVSVKQAVVEQFYRKKDEGRVLNKHQFFYDIFHPTNAGHQVMADCLGYLFSMADKAELQDEIESLKGMKAPLGNGFEEVKLLDRKNAWKELNIDFGSFCQTDTEGQKVEKDLAIEPVMEFPNNWQHAPESGNDSFSMDIECSSLILVFKDSGDKEEGVAEVYADGKLVLTADPSIVGWIHCNSLICFRDWELKKHHIEVKMKKGYEKNYFTILGWGYVR